MQYKIFINNIEKPQLLSKVDMFEITDNNGLLLDTLVISISNASYTYEIPKENAKLSIAVGNSTLFNMGTYIINKVEHSSEHIYLYAIATMQNKNNQTRSFNNKTLQDVLLTLATELDLKIEVDANIANIAIPFLAQAGQSNLQIINHLANLFNALVKIQDNTLIFMNYSNLSKEITLYDANILSIYTNHLNGSLYKGVVNNTWALDTAKNTELKIGQEPYYALNSVFTNDLLNIHMNSTLQQLKGSEQLVINTTGNPELQTGFKLKLQTNTIYPDYNQDWLIDKVTHHYNGSFTTSLLAIKI